MCVAAGLRSDLLGELMRSPRLHSRSGGPTSKGREGREGLTSNGDGREKIGDGKEGEGNPRHEVKVSRISSTVTVSDEMLAAGADDMRHEQRAAAVLLVVEPLCTQPHDPPGPGAGAGGVMRL